MVIKQCILLSQMNLPSLCYMYLMSLKWFSSHSSCLSRLRFHYRLPANTSLLWKVCFLASRTLFASAAAGPNWRGVEPPGAALKLCRWELEYGHNDGNWSMDTHQLLCPSLSKSTPYTGILASGSAPGGTQTKTE